MAPGSDCDPAWAGRLDKGKHGRDCGVPMMELTLDTLIQASSTRVSARKGRGILCSIAAVLAISFLIIAADGAASRSHAPSKGTRCRSAAQRTSTRAALRGQPDSSNSYDAAISNATATQPRRGRGRPRSSSIPLAGKKEGKKRVETSFVGVRNRGRRGAWMPIYRQLVLFRMVHGHSRVSEEAWCCRCSAKACKGCGSGEGSHLAPWVRIQLRRARRGKLSQTRTSLLSNAGINPAAPKDPVSWAERLEDLLAYRMHNGHVSVPGWPEGGALGTWTLRQRRARSRKLLGDARAEALSAAGLVWNERNVQWDVQFTSLIGFAQKHGHCNVPKRYPRDLMLAHWVPHQRREAKKGTLPVDRVKRLDGLGFSWICDRRGSHPSLFRDGAWRHHAVFASEGLEWEGCWGEETARNVMARVARGEFDRDYVDKAVEQGVIGQTEAGDWSVLFQGVPEGNNE